MSFDRRELLGRGLAAGVALVAGRAAADERGELTRAAALLPQERLAAAAAGLPLSPVELKHAPVPAALDAAPLYQELYGLEPAPQERSPRLPAVSLLVEGKPAPEKLAEARAAMKALAPQLELAHRIAARPHCAFDLHWEKVPEVTLLPHSAMRQAARLLSMEAVLLAEDGNLSGACAALAAAGMPARHAGEEPWNMGLVVLNGLGTDPAKAFQGVANRVAEQPEALAEVAALLPRVVFLPDVVFHWRGEAYFNLAATRRPERAVIPEEREFQTEEEKREERRLGRHPAQLRVEAGEARLLAFHRSVLNLMREHRDDPRRGWEVVKQRVAEERSTTELSHYASRSVADWAVMAMGAALNCLARKRLLEGYLGVLRHRMQAGALPEHLPVPVKDPFDGQPLRYQRLGEGFMVYSVGGELKDHGGRPDGTAEQRRLTLSFRRG